MKAVFLRVLDANDKGDAVRMAVRRAKGTPISNRFEIDPLTFALVPRSPFVYWVSAQMREVFARFPPFEASGRTARQGLVTADDFRFVRVHWEVLGAPSSARWWPFAKGGKFMPFYTDISAVLNWNAQGHELKAWAGSLYNESHWSRILKNTHLIGRPGLTWPHRSAMFSAAALPAGCAFSQSGKAAFIPSDELDPWLAVFNSSAVASLFRVQSDLVRIKFEVGLVEQLPHLSLSPADEGTLAALARRGWSLKRSLDTGTATSHAFVLPALLQVAGATLAARAEQWSGRVRTIELELNAVHAEIDERCFSLYGIGDEDRRAITEGFGASTSDSETPDAEEDAETEEDADFAADTGALTAELASWAVGVAFGRFDVRLATGDRPLPAEPKPFDRLPVCSPGMLTGNDGLPLGGPPAGYPLQFPEDGILVDDPGHPRDLGGAVRAVFEAVFGSRADAMWQEAAALLDPRDHDLRGWLASELFEHHLRRYSKSRRKAPILWQLGIPSGRYSIWCYAHRMTRDSLLIMQNEIVGPKFATEERRLSSLVTQAGEPPSARERAEIATQESFVDELRTLTEEVSRVAPLWNPDLDDGIVLVLAPLWRLVPTYKAWQKELRSKWDELVAGKYDWAHVAMHLWPERVILKCATDRSIAIAHGLEDVFWVEGTDGKWSARKKSTRPIAELVPDHTSRAVKAALAALLEAQQPLGAAKRRGRTSQRAS